MLIADNVDFLEDPLLKEAPPEHSQHLVTTPALPKLPQLACMEYIFIYTWANSGPGHLYKSLETAMDLIQSGFQGKFIVLDRNGVCCVYPGCQQDFMFQLELAYKHERFKVLQSRVVCTPNAALDEYLVYLKSPVIILSGTSECYQDMLSAFKEGEEKKLWDLLPRGSIFWGSNSLFSYQSYIFINGLARSYSMLPRMIQAESLRHYHYPSKITHIYLNNPKNWNVSFKYMLIALSQCYPEIPITIIASSKEHFYHLNIDLRDLRGYCDSVKNANITIVFDFSLKPNIKPETIVVAEGVGTLEDCITVGAIGIQMASEVPGCSFTHYEQVPGFCSVAADEYSDDEAIQKASNNMMAIRDKLIALNKEFVLSHSRLEMLRMIGMSNWDQVDNYLLCQDLFDARVDWIKIRWFYLKFIELKSLLINQDPRRPGAVNTDIAHVHSGQYNIYRKCYKPAEFDKYHHIIEPAIAKLALKSTPD